MAISRTESCRGRKKHSDLGKGSSQKWRRSLQRKKYTLAGKKTTTEAICQFRKSVQIAFTELLLHTKCGRMKQTGSQRRWCVHRTHWLSGMVGLLSIQTHVNIHTPPCFDFESPPSLICTFHESSYLFLYRRCQPHLIHSPPCCQGNLI